MKLFFLLTSLLSFFMVDSQKTLYGEAQGTTYTIQYNDSLNRDFQNEIDSLLYFFDLSVSTYQPESVISAINRNELKETDDSVFLYCFRFAKEIWRETKGNFDPTVYPLVNAWGFGPERKKEGEMKSAAIDSILQFVGFEKIEVSSSGMVTKRDARVSLDFNAFAQGYSVDVVSNFLQSKGIKTALIEIGGEVFGLNDLDFYWLLGVESPAYNTDSKNDTQLSLKIHNKGVATSGNYRKYREIEGQKLSHHIHPKTGRPTQNRLLSATVISNHTILSDATATGLLVMGLKSSKKYLRTHKEIDAMMIYTSMKGKFKVYKTKGFRKMEVDNKDK